MKRHLHFTARSNFFILTVIALFFSVFSFSQTVEPGFDGNGNYVILTKYDSNGDIDLSYGINGSTAHIPINYSSAVYLPDGKVILIGNTADVYYLDTHWEVRLIRVNADGTLDQTFGSNGIRTITHAPLFYDEVVSVEEMPGKIFIGVISTSAVRQSKFFRLVLYDYSANTLGSILFQDLDYFDNNAMAAVKVLSYPNNKFVVASGVTIYRYDDFNQPDLSFNGTGEQSLPVASGQSTVIKDVLIYNGKIIAGATNLDSATALFVFKVYVFNIDGSPDISFGDNGVQTVPINGYSFTRMYVNGSLLYVVSSSAVNTYPLEGTTSPTFTCPSNKVVDTDPDQCSAVVNDIDPVITPAGSSLQIKYSFSGATSGDGQGTASGKIFNKGLTTVTYSLNDDPSVTCFFTVEVQDKQAPVISFAIPQKSVLWPPNHKMVDIEISYVLTDNCGATSTLSVTSNEPQSGTGSEDQPNDWEILDAHHLRLRAERSGSGNGRTYTINVKAVDATGNASIKQVFIKVPHDASSKEELKVKAFPTPFNSSFKVSIESRILEPVNIKIYDAYGRLVESRLQVVPNSIVQLGTNYKPGLYVVEVSQGMLRQTLPVIKFQVNSNK